MATENAGHDRITERDTDILRRLAQRKAVIAQDPANQERRRAWYCLDSGNDDRVMILAEHGGVRDRIKPVPDDILECTGDWARGIENGLRNDIYRFEKLKDDHVVEPFMDVRWKTTFSNYGVEAVTHYGGDDNYMGSRSWDPPIKDLDGDFGKLHFRTFTVDREATLKEKDHLEKILGSILPVRIRGGHYWTMGMTGTAIQLIGLQQMMLAMYDNPHALHHLMKFLRDDHVNLINWLENENLYTLNNENDYIGSGSEGYTRGLPQADWNAGMPVRKQDQWVLSESQETVGVGPEQFEEFIFPYQKEIVEQFGKSYYGCCEPVHNRWHILKRINNLARVSVSPWADQEFMAESLGTKYVYSRKPNPTLVSTGVFNEQAIRQDIRNTLEIAGKCRIEIIMKDVHTLQNEPDRLPRWVEIAREETGNAG